MGAAYRMGEVERREGQRVEKHPGLYPQQCKAAQFCFRGWTEGTTRSVEDGRRVAVGGKTGAVEEDQEPRSGGRSERERRQFFKIKAVKPNLQVCRRKRVEVVKILVRRICVHDHLSPSLFCVPAFPRTLSACAFRAMSLAAPPTSLAGG